MKVFVLPDGRTATMERHTGELVTLCSEASSPPGSTLKLRSEGVVQPYEVKVRTCRRNDTGGRFIIEGRWVNLSRVQRDALGAGS